MFSQEVADRFDVALDIGCQEVLDDLTDLMRANMESDVDRFLAALEADQILPEDF
ncbi:MAG TPA: hypothetical protein VD766_02090 [Solirubrobacterales bacterium]|nr:hypothetical protein [Solirubrobacterales bacterium]